jgi:hypothetical protein
MILLRAEELKVLFFVQKSAWRFVEFQSHGDIPQASKMRGVCYCWLIFLCVGRFAQAAPLPSGEQRIALWFVFFQCRRLCSCAYVLVDC